MKKLENFLPRILPWCLGAPEPLVHQALLDSAIRFCEETNIVKYITDPITLVPGVADYDIELPTQTDLARIIRVWYGDDPWATPVGAPMNWVVTDFAGQLRIYPTPEQALPEGQYMFIEVSTKPTRTATALADSLYTNWIEGVVGGAIFRLCSTPDQPYTNLGNAQIGAAAYKVGKNAAQYESTKWRVKRDTVVRARPFA